MNFNFSSAAMVPVASLFLAGCIPAETFDGEFRDQFGGDGKTQEQLFASGYFPPSYAEPQVDCGHSTGPIELISYIEEDWYPRQWKAAREPSFFLLSERKDPPEFALRFSYIPSFTPSVFIRVHKDGNRYRLIAKELNGAGGYEPGSLARSKSAWLSAKQVMHLNGILSEGSLFDEPADTCQLGFDGSKWIFELVDQDGYRMVKRWSPKEGAARDLGLHLAQLAGWDIESRCLFFLPRPFSDVEFACD